MPPEAIMRFSADHYRAASSERLHDAVHLHRAAQFVGSIYFSGVAVECILRAYTMRASPRFSARHDLPGLARASGILSVIREHEHRDFGSHLGTVWSYWKNNLRFAEASRIRRHYAKLSIAHGDREDQLRRASDATFEAAAYIVNRGTLRWT